MAARIFDLTYNENPSSILIRQATKVITNITNANPGVVTVADSITGLANGSLVLIRNVVGMTDVNDTVFTVANLTEFTFELGVNTSPFGAYVSGGTIFELAEASPSRAMTIVFEDSLPKDQIVLAAVNAWHRLAEGLS